MMRSSGISLVLIFSAYTICSAQYLLKPVFVNESSLIPRVINGQRVALGEIPYQVGFKARMSRNYYYTFCGGTILSEKKLLSAAHCFGKAGSSCFESTVIKGSKLGRKYAVAGYLYNEGRLSHDYEGNGQWRRLSMAMWPSTYKFPFHADIAIVTVRSPFIFNSQVNKIDYARSFQDYRGTCLASGYGRMSHYKDLKSDILLKADLEIIPNYWCSLKFRRNMRKLVCTSTKPSDIGKGDSGGPLVCSGTGDPREGPRGILVGVVSGHRYHVASFFTRVSSFAKYIEKNHSEQHFAYANFKWRFIVFLECHTIYYTFFL